MLDLSIFRNIVSGKKLYLIFFCANEDFDVFFHALQPLRNCQQIYRTQYKDIVYFIGTYNDARPAVVLVKPKAAEDSISLINIIHFSLNLWNPDNVLIIGDYNCKNRKNSIVVTNTIESIQGNPNLVTEWLDCHWEYTQNGQPLRIEMHNKNIFLSSKVRDYSIVLNEKPYEDWIIISKNENSDNNVYVLLSLCRTIITKTESNCISQTQRELELLEYIDIPNNEPKLRVKEYLIQLNKKAILYSGILAILAIIISSIFSLISMYSPAIKVSPIAKIADMKISETEATTCINFDFTLENLSDSDIYINQIFLNVKDYYEMAYANTTLFHRLQSTYTYDAQIIGDITPEIIKIDNVSQVIPAKSFDRFTILVSNCDYEIFRQTISLVEFEFIDSNGNSIKTGDILVTFDCESFDKEALNTDHGPWRSIYNNYLSMKRFKLYNCNYKMESFNTVFESYSMYENIIMDRGKRYFEEETSLNSYKIENLNIEQMSYYLLNTFTESSYIYSEAYEDKVLFAFKLFDDSDDNIYIISDDAGIIKSVFIPAKCDDVSFSPIFICNEIIYLLDPSINNYWYKQRIVDLNFHENVRFWSDENIFARFEYFKNTPMLRFDIM